MTMGSDAVSKEDEKMCQILVVEDDPSTAAMLSAYFASLGYEVTHANWGQDAVKLATEIQPDLVILDIHLPDIDGYEVCMRLRNQTRTETTPIIFLTERRERDDRLTGLELGAVDYVTKPFDMQELRFRVRNVLRRSNRESLLNPITGLPTSILIEEVMEEVAEDPSRALVSVAMRGMKDFSDAYGFVTHDDVLRAVALILRNTAAECMGEGVFVGQVDLYQYVIMTPAGQNCYMVMGRLHQRLNEAASFFYPHTDWERGARSGGMPIPMIQFDIQPVEVASFAHPGGLAELRAALTGSHPERQN